jgi:TRAP transporter TAXI family solute receptor
LITHGRISALAFWLGLSVLAGIVPAGAAEFFASVGTGPLSGTYYPTGRALCDLVNRQQPERVVRCSVEPTPGSVYNLEALRTGELDFAIVQSDVQAASHAGDGPWRGRPFRGLRAVLSLYPELVTIVARKDSGIAQLEELKGRRVNIGNPGSGARATWEAMEAALGWRRDELQTRELKAEVAAQALCDGSIEASVQVIGHPSPFIAKELAACSLQLASAAGPAVDSLVGSRPYFRKASIPAAAYGAPSDVPTFGSSATLVTRADVPEEVVHALAKAVLANLDQIKGRLPILASLDAQEMVRVSLTAPLHRGAEQAYRELGLIK